MKKGMIISFLMIVAILLALTNFLSCGKSIDTGHPMYGVMGIIRDKVSNQPIDSAWIDLDTGIAPYWTYSDSNGAYTLFFYTGSENQKTIIAGKVGFHSFDTIINISVPQYILDTVNIDLEPE